MSAYPPQLKAAAKKLLDNDDFRVLIQYREGELKEDVIENIEEKDILQAHTELTHLKLFGQWIQMLAEDPYNKGTKQ